MPGRSRPRPVVRSEDHDRTRHEEVVAIAELRVNGYIRAPEVRVVAPDGSQIGVKKLEEALWLAEQLGLDLVEVAPNARPPVVKIMDYGKYKYELSVKEREARKKQSRVVVKELRLRPQTSEHDYQVVRRKAQQFLEEGDKVKVIMRFRGRQVERPDLGRRLLDRLVEELGPIAKVYQAPKMEGRQMTMILHPTGITQAQLDAEAEADAAAIVARDEAEAAAERSAETSADEASAAPPRTEEPAQEPEETPVPGPEEAPADA